MDQLKCAVGRHFKRLSTCAIILKRGICTWVRLVDKGWHITISHARHDLEFVIGQSLAKARIGCGSLWVESGGKRRRVAIIPFTCKTFQDHNS